MQGYSDFPPFIYLKRILQTSPHSALLYASIWKMKNKENKLKINRSEVKRKLFISATLFRNHLYAIGSLDLLKFHETPEAFLIEFEEPDAI